MLKIEFVCGLIFYFINGFICIDKKSKQGFFLLHPLVYLLRDFAYISWKAKRNNRNLCSTFCSFSDHLLIFLKNDNILNLLMQTQHY